MPKLLHLPQEIHGCDNISIEINRVEDFDTHGLWNIVIHGQSGDLERDFDELYEAKNSKELKEILNIFSMAITGGVENE